MRSNALIRSARAWKANKFQTNGFSECQKTILSHQVGVGFASSIISSPIFWRSQYEKLRLMFIAANAIIVAIKVRHCQQQFCYLDRNCYQNLSCLIKMLANLWFPSETIEMCSHVKPLARVNSNRFVLTKPISRAQIEKANWKSQNEVYNWIIHTYRFIHSHHDSTFRIKRALQKSSNVDQFQAPKVSSVSSALVSQQTRKFEFNFSIYMQILAEIIVFSSENFFDCTIIIACFIFAQSQN